MTYSASQNILLALMPKLSGLASLLGSLWILVEVATDPHKARNAYHRLLLGLSAVDALSSTAMFLSTWPMNGNDDDDAVAVVWARGTEATCQAQGFVIQLGIASPIYNALLLLYYRLILQWGWTESQLERVEWGMHAMAWSVGLTTASAGLCLDLYHNANVWCWIAPNSNDDEIDNHASLYRWTFYYGILWPCLLLAILGLGSIYHMVRQRELQQGPPPPQEGPAREESTSSWILPATKTSSNNTQQQQQPLRRSFLLATSQQPSFRDSWRRSSLQKRQHRRSSTTIPSTGGSPKNSANSDGTQISTGSLPPVDTERRKIAFQRIKHHSDGDPAPTSLVSRNRSSTHAGDRNATTRDLRVGQATRRPFHRQSSSISTRQIAHVVDTISKLKSSRRLSEATQHYGSRSVLDQALWYTVAFLVTYTFATIHRIFQQFLGNTGGTVPFIWAFLHVSFIPLQGAWNFLVYRRNACHRLRQRHPHLTYWQAFFRSFRWTFLGPPRIPTELEPVDDDDVHEGDSLSSDEGSKRSDLLEGAASPTEQKFMDSMLSGWTLKPSSCKYSDDSNEDFGSSPYESMGRFGYLDDIDDEFMASVLDDMVADYAEYPNLLTDTTLTATSFPTLRLDLPEKEGTPKDKTPWQHSPGGFSIHHQPRSSSNPDSKWTFSDFLPSFS